MDEREALAMSGAASFFMYRGFTPSGWQPGLHGLQGVQSFPSPTPNLPMQPPNIGGGGSMSSVFRGESPSSVSPHVGVNMSRQAQDSVIQAEPVKKKRGRPRKYGPDGTARMGLSSVSLPRDCEMGGTGSAPPMQKRGRGRPPGTGRKQQLASYGELVSSSAGMGFTPHVLMIMKGEDIAAKVASFSELGPRAVCILAATGAVSTAMLRQRNTSVNYEGHLEILSLSLSSLLTNHEGSHSQNGGLTVSLSRPDSHVIGGEVTGPLIAANQVQVIVGSFLYSGGTKVKHKSRPSSEPVKQETPVNNDDEKQMTPSNIAQQPDQNPISGWPGSSPMDMRNFPTGIDLTRG